MIKAKTKEKAYWESFKLEEEDLDALFDLLSDGKPHPIQDLAKTVVAFRIQKEQQAIARALEYGKIYQPRLDYEVGDRVVFPSMEYQTGEVIDKRPGVNPEYGEFNVIKVKFPDREETLEFAAAFTPPHKLNIEGDWREYLKRESGASVEETLAEYGETIQTRIEQSLLESHGDEFVSFNGKWLLADAMLPIGEGELNIAEAVIDQNGMPTTREEILKEIDLPEDVPQEIKDFSLDYALKRDERFVNVGSAESPRWFLWRMLPDGIREVPIWLRYTPVEKVSDEPLNVDLLQIRWELADEWSEGMETFAEDPDQVQRTTITLSYPHWRAGTIPLNYRLLPFVVHMKGKIAPVRFVDTRRGKRFMGWIVREGRYIAGLKEWFQERQVPIGGYIVIEKNPDDPEELLIDIRSHRMRREWVNVPTVEDGRLTFGTNRIAVSCEYDEAMLLGEGNWEEIDALRESAGRKSIVTLVHEIFPELAKKNSQGTVHAKALYQAVNLIRRCPPEPIFSVLVSSPEFVDSGNGFWFGKGSL